MAFGGYTGLVQYLPRRYLDPLGRVRTRGRNRSTYKIGIGARCAGKILLKKSTDRSSLRLEGASPTDRSWPLFLLRTSTGWLVSRGNMGKPKRRPKFILGGQLKKVTPTLLRNLFQLMKFAQAELGLSNVFVQLPV